MSKTKDLRTIDQTVIDEAIARQVATHALGNKGVAEIAKLLAITPASVRTIQASERYKELVSATAEQELGPALAKAKAQLARLSSKAVTVVEKTMDMFIADGKGARDALAAASVVLKSVGLHEEEDKQQDATINIVLPTGVGLNETKTIDVTSEIDE